MLTNFDCGCMWVRNRNELEEALCVNPLYLKHDHQHLTTDFRVRQLDNSYTGELNHCINERFVAYDELIYLFHYI